REYTAGAVAEIAPVLGLFRLFSNLEPPAHGQVEDELRPILHQVHAFFVAAGILVPIVALERRTHGEQVFDSDLVFARVGVLQFALVLGQQRQNFGVNARKLALLNRQTDQYAGHALGGGAGVAQRGGIAIEIAFVG